MKILTLIVCLICLSSCSSTPEKAKTKYYLLNSPSINKAVSLTATNIEQSNKKEILLVIEVAEYLQQPFIAMQIDEHTLYYAQSHLWAEPLKNEIMVALAQELNLSSNNNRYELIKGNAAMLPDDKLFITVEHFHASNTGNIILTGNFQWFNQATENTESAYSAKQPFYLETPLEIDGFTHSIGKMRTLLTNLAIEINKS